jgi:hypothetical protein
MAENGGAPNVSFAPFNSVNGVQYDFKCLKCVQLEDQFEEMHLELSSMQLIIKLLYREFTSHTSVSNTVGCMNAPSLSSCTAVNGVNTGTGVQNKWTILSLNHCNSTISQGNSLPCHPSYHVPISNRYAILASQDTSEFYAVDNQNISSDPKLWRNKSVLRNHSEMRRKGRNDYQ